MKTHDKRHTVLTGFYLSQALFCLSYWSLFCLNYSRYHPIFNCKYIFNYEQVQLQLLTYAISFISFSTNYVLED